MAPMPMLVSLHSPLVGPLTWQPAAASLRAAGYHVAVPSLTGVVDTGPPYYRKLAGRVAETIRQDNPARAVVLIGHSGRRCPTAGRRRRHRHTSGGCHVRRRDPAAPGGRLVRYRPAVLREQLRGPANLAGRIPYPDSGYKGITDTLTGWVLEPYGATIARTRRADEGQEQLADKLLALDNPLQLPVLANDRDRTQIVGGHRR
jgi:hypothetical protein